MTIVIIDNYDSFTFNLVQRFGELDDTLDIQVFRNDKVSLEQIEKLAPSHLILSPGPCTPDEAGVSVDCVKHFSGRIPLLGVCLGHQSIGAATGGKVVAAEKLMHGTTDQIYHDGSGLFDGLSNPMIATRYHSLMIEPSTLHPDLVVSAWCYDRPQVKTIMAIRHRTLPLYGLQFHPESFLTEEGPTLLNNFLVSTVE